MAYQYDPIPSGKHTKSYLKMAIEIVDLPRNMVIFHDYDFPWLC
jgi:hypothetical protein